MFLVHVEGNIGSGKSTFLNYMKCNYGDSCSVITEPVHLWRDVDGNNLLEQYYSQPHKYAEIFQTHAFLTTVGYRRRQMTTENNNIVFVERSLDSSVFCFSKVLCSLGLIRPELQTVFEKNFHLFEEPRPDRTIYFRTENIDVLKGRISRRARAEEIVVSDNFLSELNSAHDKLFFRDDNAIVIPADLPLETLQINYFEPIWKDILTIAKGGCVGGIVPEVS